MAARYWVNDDSDGDWDGTNNWSTSSGGAGGAATPTSSDDVTFDSGSNDNCTLSANAICNAFTVTTDYTATLDINDFDITFHGNVDISGTVTWTKGTGTITFTGTANQSADFNDLTIEDIEVDKASGAVDLAGHGFTTDSFLITDGYFDTNSQDVNVTGDFVINDTYHVRSGTTTVSGTTITLGALLDGSATGLFVTDGTGVTFNGNAATTWSPMKFEGTCTLVSTAARWVTVSALAVSEIAAGATVTLQKEWRINKYGLNVNGDLILDAASGDTIDALGEVANLATITVGSAGSVTQDVGDGGTCKLIYGKVMVVAGGNWDVDGVSYNNYVGFSGVINGTGTWRPWATSSTMVLSGDTTLGGDFTVNHVDASTATIQPSNYDLTLQGDFTVVVSGGGALAWTKGIGDITFSGSASQDVDLNDLTVEDAVVNKSGGLLTFTDGFTTDSFTGTDGDCDVNGQLITVTGNLDIDGGT